MIPLEQIKGWGSFETGVAWVSYFTPARHLFRMFYFSFGYFDSNGVHRLALADKDGVLDFSNAKPI